MGLSRLSEQCQKCPFVSQCKSKRMEALAYLPEPMAASANQSELESMAAPALRETIEIQVNGNIEKKLNEVLRQTICQKIIGG